jgi:hypothetical protein
MERNVRRAQLWVDDLSGPLAAQPVASALTDVTLTEGQRRRVRLFQAVEPAVASRIERACLVTGMEVTDVAVLVVSPDAHGMLFGEDAREGITVVIGHRTKLYTFLSSLLNTPGDGVDPYVDLLSAAPPRCVRVLVVDRQALTVISYGSFVAIPLDPETMPQA